MELVKSIFEYLNINCNYAVLRNFEGLPKNNPGRDIDILITREDFLQIRKDLIAIIISTESNIISYYRIERESFICSSYDNGRYKLIQLDFLFACEVKGVILINSSDILKRRVFNGDVYHVCPEYEYLTKFLYNKLLNHPYPKRYSSLEKLMKGNPFVQNEIDRIFNISLDELNKTSGSILWRKKLITNLYQIPFPQIYNITRIIYRKLINHFNPSGFSIGFTGPDGVGKTTIINSISLQLEEVVKVKLYHFRPTLFSNISDVTHKAGLKKVVDKDYSNPHRGKKVGLLNSFFRLLYYSTDYILGYITQTLKLMKRSQIIIFDRYYTDIIADSLRSKIFLNHKILYRFGKLFIPKLDYNILLTADKEIILSRKQELTEEGIENINKKLNFLSKKKGYQLVFNNTSPDDAVHEILNIVFKEQHKRNIRRIGK